MSTTNTESQIKDFDPCKLIDEAFAAGDLIFDEVEGMMPANPDATDAVLDDIRASRKAEANDSDDATPQERIILGQILQGTRDNSTRWAKFRQTLGLTPGQTMPLSLWSDPANGRIAEEIDAAFNGKRDIKQINSSALIQAYQLRTERGQGGSLQAFSMAVQELVLEADSFVENDFLIAIEILQSKSARKILSTASRQLEHQLRADRPVETVVKDLLAKAEDAKQLVSGRLGDDLEFDDFDSLHDVLLDGMEAEKAEPISTNIRALDIDLQGGVNVRNTGKLNVIGARTGVGKTTVAIAAAMGLTLNGAHTLFMSCELDAVEIGARAMSYFAQRNKLFSCKSWILEGHGNTRQAPVEYQKLREFWVAQRQAGHIGDFRSKALFHASAEDFVEYMYAAKAADPKLSAVFLDHFHALKPSKGYNNRSQEMEARILYLHQAAKACKVDLFLMAQLNRDACLAQRPSLEHINGTDAIAQLATAVWLLEFPKREEGEPFDPNSLTCHHAKFRNGQRDYDGSPVREEETYLTVTREHCYITCPQTNQA
ncbi:predicted protein [Cyanophage PSS2]|uniref:prophage replicative DNA helicase n=1 Tax=Cyanophage PSS2 TaxID=658401 RepID=UPI0001B04043|nr:prophage replicative DNA helicase [Cyanophage PSS2]ACT65670.1 prophage replicative DNA helicase [Cyanophage PSS2]ACY75810.1 predicted protein [Cyanophage PSS2]